MTATLTDLLGEGRQLGFLGPGAVEAHIRHATAFVAAVPAAPARALDLGAGGGVPGLVLAATAWPTTTWCLLDARARRTAFLREAVAALDLTDRVEVLTARAEEVAHRPTHRGRHDLVVARSFGPPAVTAECGAPLLRVGGHLVVSEPPDVPVAQRWPSPAVAELGLAPAEPVVSAEPGETPVHLVRLRLVAPVGDRVPRRVGLPAKRPRF